MAEAVVVSPASSIQQRVNRDRLFYSGMAIAMALTVFIGFAQTYYAPLVGSGQLATISGRPLTPLLHVHGVLFTAWVLLFVAQTALVATHRVRIHQRMGMAGAVLAGSMIVAGSSLAISSAAAGMTVPGVHPLAFMVVPLGDMVFFTLFVGAALWQRRNREAHKRLMLLAYASILAAAVARLPGMIDAGPFAFYGGALAFVVLGVAYDLISRRRVHPVYIWGGLVLALSVPGRLMLSETAAWMAFAELLTR